ncbi:MAG: AMP-binding protein [Microcoleaceae cyanobacterium]
MSVELNYTNLVRPANPFVEFPKDALESSIPERFSEQVRKYPDRIAVQTKNDSWNYRTLDHKAKAIAQEIFARYSRTSEIVALLLEHDGSIVASILGILKAGKAYVCLDPSYPQSRLRYILEDSQAVALVTNNKNWALAEELTHENLAAINLDIIEENKYKNPVTLSISPDTIASLVYTSGSTGQPKAVVHIHRNLLHYVRTYTNRMYLSCEDRISGFSSFSFISSILEVFGALLNGGTFCPIDLKEEGLARVAQSLAELKITVYTSTPTVYRHLLETRAANLKQQQTPFPQVRLINIGGETVTKKDVQLYEQYFADNCLFVNSIGSSESLFFLYYCINKGTAPSITNVVPVGYPTSEETEVFLLDEAGERTENDGEIAIRTPYLALGYWQKPELTQTVFLPDPEGGNRRIYRTGDLGHLRPDGVWEHKGRKGFQVKIRGLRIELGEIEAVLTQHPEVPEAAVTVRDDIFNDKCLVAYCVAKEKPLEIDSLRGFLRKELPDYMVPSAFVFLEAIPVTPNGKVDRRALPAPNVSKLSQEARGIAPRTTTELQLGQIWSEMLNIPAVGVQDNFFDLGGNSLLAMRLMARIEQQLGTHLALTTLFTEATIERQASLLSAAPNTQPFSPLVPIQPRGSLPPFFCIHPRAGGVLSYLTLARQLGDKLPFYGVQALGIYGEQEPLSRIEEMATTYIKAIQTVQPQGRYKLGGWSFGGNIAFEIARQLHSLGQEVALLALIDSLNPIILNKPKRDDAMLVRLAARLLSQGCDDLESYLLLNKELIMSMDELRQLGLDEQLSYVFKETKRLHNLPPEIGLEHMHQLFAVLQAHNHAIHSYVPQPYPGKITLFSAEEHPAQLAEKQIQFWSSLATGGITIHKIPGEQLSIIESEALAKELRSYLRSNPNI